MLKNRTLAEAVKNLWYIYDDLCRVCLELEDEEGVLRYRGIGRKFEEALETVDALICYVEEADRFMNGQRRKVAK